MAEAPTPGARPRVTVGELWHRVAVELDDRSAARWLCEVATGLDPDELAAALDEPATAPMVTHLEAMLVRYRGGEPLQYVLGRWGFRHLDLAIDRRVLIPRPETELVAGIAIELAAAAVAARGRAMAADLGTGSGAIGLSLACELPLGTVEVWMTDRDLGALDVARANLAGLGRRGVDVRLAAGSWFAALPDDVAFDVIVSNPPYVAVGDPEVAGSVVEWEPAGALFAGADGLDDIRVLVEGAPERLRAGGWLVLEIGAAQGRAVTDLFEHHRYDSVEIRPDATGRDRVALGRRPAIG